MRSCIDSTRTPYNGLVIEWSKIILLKVRCIVWRAMQGKIHVAMELTRRGVTVHFDLCVLCGDEKESVYHLHVNCKVVEENRDWIFKWCELRKRQFVNMDKFVNFGALWGNIPKKRLTVTVNLYCLLWHVWNGRNNKVFNKVQSTPTKIADDIISQSFLSFKYKSLNLCGRWVDWIISPFTFC